MRIAIAGGLAALVIAAMAPDGVADVGPIDPARRICMGLAEGAACTIDGKAGTCHGPHPSRMYCTPGPAPNQGSASAVTGSGSAGSGSGSGAAGSAQPSAAGSAQPSTPSDPEPAPTPGHKRGCAVADPGGAALAGLAFAALVWRRRGGRRTMR